MLCNTWSNVCYRLIIAVAFWVDNFTGGGEEKARRAAHS